MSEFTRFAIYYLPPDGALSDFGARWLGWDVSLGVPCADVIALDLRAEITKTPRKYGFHATLKPPFRLAEGSAFDDLRSATAELARSLHPVAVDGLSVSRIGSFLALTADGDARALNKLAAGCVQDLDAFRAPPPASELARRRAANLTHAQNALLEKWGYPYVMEEFRFHMTLTGRLDPDTQTRAEGLLDAYLPALPRPFGITQIALVGELANGAFQLMERFELGARG